MSSILLITPPFTQLNTPYPATAYLKGFLNTKQIPSFQVDLGIEVILELFTPKVLEALIEAAYDAGHVVAEEDLRFYTLRTQYLRVLTPVMHFLQGRNEALARQICAGNFLPQSARFEQVEELDWAFGEMGFLDKAKHLATLYLETISDFIVSCIDPHFGFSRYAERLGKSANAFDELYEELQEEASAIDEITLALLHQHLVEQNPALVCFSVPFPGNLYSAFKSAQYIKEYFPHIKIAMGGGFPNTELRSLKDPRVFDFFDFITLDDGELPVELLCQNVQKGEVEFKRTFLLEDREVVYKNNSLRPDYKASETGTPDYTNLKLDQYISVIEMANAMHSLWSDGQWLKLTMAHGCYWGKCTFCDISLDYIKVYEPLRAKELVDRMELMMEQTGKSGFHFVDEAAPPALMKAVALEIIQRQLVVTWWTNIRFEKSFTADLCRLLKASGCIAVSGGLEVASDRLLKLIDKGVTVEQVAQVTRNFTGAGIMVHAYLMYGYPTQTVQETVDSLEMVRQLFELGIVQSGFWHQFALTAHSPIGMEPEKYHIQPHLKEISFAHNDVAFTDETGIDHAIFSFGLKKALFNYMHGIGFEFSLQDWFDFKIPRTKIHPNYIADSLEEAQTFHFNARAKVVYLHPLPLVKTMVKTKKGMERKQMEMIFHTSEERIAVVMDLADGLWLENQLKAMKEQAQCAVSLSTWQERYESAAGSGDFLVFWYSKALQKLRKKVFMEV